MKKLLILLTLVLSSGCITLGFDRKATKFEACVTFNGSDIVETTTSISDKITAPFSE